MVALNVGIGLITRYQNLTESEKLTLITAFLYKRTNSEFPDKKTLSFLCNRLPYFIDQHLFKASEIGFLINKEGKLDFDFNMLSDSLGIDGRPTMAKIFGLTLQAEDDRKELLVGRKSHTKLKTEQDVTSYIRGLYKDEEGKSIRIKANEKNQIRILLKTYGEEIKALIDFFVKYRAKYALGDFSVTSLFQSHKKINSILSKRRGNASNQR